MIHPFCFLVSSINLSRELLAEELLKGLSVVGEFFDALMELVESHLVLQQSPTELGLVVDEADLGNRIGFGS